MAGRRTLAERAKYRSLSEAAEDLGLTARQLRRRVDQGVIPPPAARRAGGRYLWTPEEVTEAARRLGASEPHAEVRSGPLGAALESGEGKELPEEFGESLAPHGDWPSPKAVVWLRATSDLARAAELSLTGRMAEAEAVVEVVRRQLDLEVSKHGER